MTKYFFHTNLCGDFTPDPQGQTMIDTASAIQAAIRKSWHIMADEVSRGRLCLSCHIEVENADSGDRTIVRFRDALRITDLEAACHANT